MFLISLLVVIIFQPPLPPVEMPTPFPTQVAPEAVFIDPDSLPKSEIYSFLATAVAEVNSLPDDLSSVNGLNIVPDETGTQLMSYAKWLASANTANELLGYKFAPIGINLYILLVLAIFMFSAWLTITIVSLLVRFVQYLISWILKLIPFVG